MTLSRTNTLEGKVCPDRDGRICVSWEEEEENCSVALFGASIIPLTRCPLSRLTFFPLEEALERESAPKRTRLSLSTHSRLLRFPEEIPAALKRLFSILPRGVSQEEEERLFRRPAEVLPVDGRHYVGVPRGLRSI